MYDKASILRTVGNLFYGSYDYLVNILTGVDDFEERVEIEWALKKNPVYKPGKGFNIERDLSDYAIVDKSVFNALRAKVEKSTYGKADIRSVKKLLKEYIEKDRGVKLTDNHLKKMEEGKFQKPLLFLPHSQIFHAYYVYINLLELSKKGKLNKVLKFIENLRNRNVFFKNDLVNQFLTVLRKAGFQLSVSQIETLKKCLENTFVAVDGVPGSGKTTMLAIFYLLVSLFLSKKRNRASIVFTANTYAAIKEFLRKISELLNVKEVQEFFKEMTPINLYAFLKDEHCNNSKCEEDFYQIKRSLEKISKEGIVEFNCISSRLQIKKVNEGVNLIILPISKFRRYYRDGIEIEVPVDVLMIDEASQVSGFSSIEILGKINLTDNSKIVMVGDRSQLPPVYSVIEDEIPLYSIGILYNLYTFFQDKYLSCNLWETKRLPEGTVEIVRDLYSHIESKKTKKFSIKLKEDGILRDILETDDLSTYPLIRIRVIYPEENRKYRRSNEVEAEVIKMLLNEISPEAKVAVMTSFREQEGLLLKTIKENKNCIIGTVDKLQGREVHLGIISLVSNHPIYAKEIVSFICTPNRLNVALTRASETTILIHSDVLEKEIEVAFDSDGIEKAKEMAIGYKKFRRSINDISSFLKEFPALNYELGFQMMRKFFRLTEYAGNISLSNGVVAEVYAYKFHHLKNLSKLKNWELLCSNIDRSVHKTV